MDRDILAFWITVASALCWIICFWWMHRISTRQDALLAELREQTNRIEGLSQVEHDLIREVHPQVGEIKQTMEKVASQVSDDADGVRQETKNAPREGQVPAGHAPR